ncbi:regulator of G-protein signaling 9-binding protein [Stegostoma tigrinum]|uniref:regulator of G-protein signaling 9-binding protein n=1 Tax=Stegostoma tigrinum TaxID=3053191 RepID=UPI00286FCD92|nr:regulator of G-protein signaling 9-binding protein [Stegostoma tigrinum]
MLETLPHQPQGLRFGNSNWEKHFSGLPYPGEKQLVRYLIYTSHDFIDLFKVIHQSPTLQGRKSQPTQPLLIAQTFRSSWYPGAGCAAEDRHYCLCQCPVPASLPIRSTELSTSKSCSETLNPSRWEKVRLFPRVQSATPPLPVPVQGLCVFYISQPVPEVYQGTTLSCLRSYLLCQLSEPGWGAEMLNDCRRTQGILNTLGVSHRELALSLGGACDLSQLRQKLQDIRSMAHQHSAVTETKLTFLLSSSESLKPEQRAELQRECMLFASCMELLHRDLRQVRRLQLLFPLEKPQFLINTGLTGDPSGPTSEPSGEKGGSGELSLDALILEVGRLLSEMETRVPAPVWSSDATTEPWAEASSDNGPDTASTDRLTEEETEGSRNCKRCCIIS